VAYGVVIPLPWPRNALVERDSNRYTNLAFAKTR